MCSRRTDSDKGNIEKMLQDLAAILIPAGQLCKLMQIDSKGKFTMDDFDKQFRMRIEIDGQKVFGADSTQDEFFSYIAETSQCTNCGIGSPPNFPKMLTCSACKIVHYCNKTCQREHWKRGHKALCMGKTIPKEVFRVAYFCSKMLSFLSLGLDTEQEMTINADSSHLRTALLKSSCKDHIYMPVFEDGTLMYIPMPLKFVAYFFAEGDQKVFRGTGLESFNDSEQHITIAVQITVPVDKTTRKCAIFIMTKTPVRLP